MCLNTLSLYLSLFWQMGWFIAFLPALLPWKNKTKNSLCQSRAALSVLAYTYYQMQDFVNASDCYEQLSTLHPEVEEYRLYYAQSLYKACLFQEAMKVACMIDQPQYQGQVGTP